jgi:hypothetical protein
MVKGSEEVITCFDFRIITKVIMIFERFSVNLFGLKQHY